MPDAAVDILAGIEGIPHTEVRGGGGHELHEPLGPLARDGARVETGFGADDCGHEPVGDSIAVRRLNDLVQIWPGVPRRKTQPSSLGAGRRSPHSPVLRVSGRVREVDGSVGALQTIDLGPGRGRRRDRSCYRNRSEQSSHGSILADPDPDRVDGQSGRTIRLSTCRVTRRRRGRGGDLGCSSAASRTSSRTRPAGRS